MLATHRSAASPAYQSCPPKCKDCDLAYAVGFSILKLGLTLKFEILELIMKKEGGKVLLWVVLFILFVIIMTLKGLNDSIESSGYGSSAQPAVYQIC